MIKKKELIRIPNNKYEIPIYILTNNFENKKAILFVQGLGGGGSAIFSSIKNKKILDDYLVFGFDQREHGNNQNQAPASYKKIVKDLDKIISTLVQKYNLEEVNLIGESWGSTLIFIYQNKFKNPIVKKVIGWNMPYSIFNNENPHPNNTTILSNIRVIFTYLTKIPTYDYRPFNEALTNNKTLIRINKNKKDKQNNRLPIIAWQSFKKSWKIISQNNSNNLIYIQSLEDVFRTQKTIEKNKEKIIILKQGTHILSLDKQESENLINLIQKKLK